MDWLDTFPAQAFYGKLLAPHGQLEIMTTPGADLSQIAVICHPHPLHDGTMHNKVVTTLAKACQNLGMPTVRFNYRGVGKSSGEYGQLTGEIDDLQTVLAWLKKSQPNAQIGLAGFSFGSYISAHVANLLPDAAWLISVAPAVHHADFTELQNITCPWLVIMGDEDEVVPPADVYAWAAKTPQIETLQRFADATHFFHGKLGPLRTCVQSWLEAY